MAHWRGKEPGPAVLCIPQVTLNDIFISLEASIPPFLVSQVLEAICSALGKTKFWGHLTVGVMTDCRHLRSRDGLGAYAQELRLLSQSAQAPHAHPHAGGPLA